MSKKPVMIHWVSDKGVGFINKPTDEYSVGWIEYETEDSMMLTPHKGKYKGDESFSITKSKIKSIRKV